MGKARPGRRGWRGRASRSIRHSLFHDFPFLLAHKSEHIIATKSAAVLMRWHGCGREVDEDGEGAPWKEQETWEGEQIKKASMHVGAQDRAAAAAQYDFVIDDQIEFIKDQALAGDLVPRPPLLHPHPAQQCRKPCSSSGLDVQRTMLPCLGCGKAEAGAGERAFCVWTCVAGVWLWVCRLSVCSETHFNLGTRE